MVFIGAMGILKSETGTWKPDKEAGGVEEEKLDESWDEENSLAMLWFCADFCSLQNSRAVQK